MCVLIKTYDSINARVCVYRLFPKRQKLTEVVIHVMCVSVYFAERFQSLPKLIEVAEWSAPSYKQATVRAQSAYVVVSCCHNSARS